MTANKQDARPLTLVILCAHKLVHPATPVMLEPAWKLGEDAPSKTGMFCAPFSFTGQPALVLRVDDR